MLNFVLPLLIISTFVNTNPISDKNVLEKTKKSFRNQSPLNPQIDDIHEKLNDLAAANASMSAAKRKLETELQTLHSDLDELLNEAKNSEEKAKKAMVDAARLADELRAEKDHALTQEKLRKALENQIKDLQVRLDEAEAKAIIGGKNTTAKLDQRKVAFHEKQVKRKN